MATATAAAAAAAAAATVTDQPDFLFSRLISC